MLLSCFCFGQLEVDFSCYLHYATVALRRRLLNAQDLSEGRRAQVAVRSGKLRVVEGVKGLKPQLDVL